MPNRTPPFAAAAEFGRRVRARRHALGYSQERLAELSGLHWTYVGSVERGMRNIALHNLLRLSRALQLDAAELVRGLSVSD